MIETNNPRINTFDMAYMDAVDVVTAGINSADRPMIARLAARHDEAETFAPIVAPRGKNWELGALAYRGWLAGFRAAVLDATATDAHFGQLVRAAQWRAADIDRGRDRLGVAVVGKWVVCPACADLGVFTEDGRPVACGYCSAKKHVMRKPSNLRVWLTAVIKGGN